jgi:RNA polymerase sigma factor (sigma-70 family)
MTDFQLLQQYARDGSEAAFAELMNRHIHWVLSVCRQQVRDPALAEDVTQAVFLTLSRKASTLRETTSISGWLFITSRYAATSALKIEQRRRRNERQAANMKHEATQPHDAPATDDLDAAIATLKSNDREAVILRFFRGLTHQSIADTLGITEEAAQKRVNRALDRLRKKLGPSAATFAVEPIAAALAERATQFAPPHLAARNLTALKTGPTANTQAIMKGMTAMKRAFALRIAATAGSVALLCGLAVVFAVDSSNTSPKPTPLPSTAPVASAIPATGPAQTLGTYDLASVQVIRVSGIENGLRYTNYYNRQKIVVGEMAAAGWSATRYTLDQTEWDYHDGGSLILRKKPLETADPQVQKVISDISSLQKAPATREPDLDQDVDGTTCQAYHLADGPGQSKNTFVFINPATGRPALIKSDEPARDITMAYDPPLPDDFFKVPSKPGVQIVDARDYFEKKYPLDGALFTQEAIGQIFAVHEATQDAASCYHVVCSCRLSPAVRRALNDQPDDLSLGKFMMDPHAQFPFHYVRLAEMSESGMQVTYLLAIPIKPGAQDDLCQLPVTMASSPTIFKSGIVGRGPGKGNDVHIEVKLPTPFQPGAPTAEQFASRAYDDEVPLIGMVGGGWIYGPRTDAGVNTKEEYLAALKLEIAKYLPADASTNP